MKTLRLLPCHAVAVAGVATMSLSAPGHAEVIAGGSGMMNGHPVSAFIETGADNKITSVGFKLSGAAVRDPGHVDAVAVLTLPPQAVGAPFRILTLDWNPHGHPPKDIYTFAHFDLHFYYVTDEVRRKIVAAPTTPDPGPRCRPADYAPPAATVPQMGGHAYDMTGAEFHGGKFTHTFIYGYHDLQQQFVEPVVAQDYLIALQAPVTGVIRQPAHYALPAFPSLAPTSYKVAVDRAKDEYTISVGGFIAVPEPTSNAPEACKEVPATAKTTP
jgi:hypothetical protein